MNFKIIQNWNSIIKENDEIYILGDYVWRIQKSFDLLKDITSKLNGNKYLIRGNHDRYSNYEYLQAGIKDVFDIYSRNFFFNDQLFYFTLSHYSMRCWDRSHFGSYCLYGHQHFQQEINFDAFKILGMSTRTMNICSDGNDLYPYPLQEILNKIKNNPINFIQR